MLVNIAPTAGNISVGPFSSTAVPARAVVRRARVAARLSDVTRLSSSVRLRLCQARSAARASQVANVNVPAACLRSDRAADGRSRMASVMVRGEIAEADEPREIGRAHPLPLGQGGKRHAIAVEECGMELTRSD